MEVQVKLTVEPDLISLDDGNAYLMVAFCIVDDEEIVHVLEELTVKWEPDDTEETMLEKLDSMKKNYTQKALQVASRVQATEGAREAARKFYDKYKEKTDPEKKEDENGGT